MRGILALVLGLSFWSGAAVAHEFWVEPDRYVLSSGETVKANLRVGQDFGGTRYPFLSRRFQSFEMADADGRRDLPGTEGDLPAVNVTAADGLLILGYHSNPDRLTFHDFAKFDYYVRYEGLDWALEEHRKAGLPETGFTEAYTRNAKALVQIGTTPGADVALGLPFEIVVDGSPYAPGLTAVPVRLLRLGQPAPDWQINIFTRPDGGEVTLTHVRTDAQGRATIPFDGQVDVMLNAVWLQRPDGKSDVDWESWWASTTFGRVGREG